uniref:Putative IstB domain protein ATP-binding protein n=1 Tax=viral metagenome TaxID=1070528 RepID=A0A6M3LWU4_9ZZZZ
MTEAETSVCPDCHGLGLVRRDVNVGHPDFGKAIPCPECYWDQRHRYLFAESIWRRYARARLTDFSVGTQNLVRKSLNTGHGCYIQGPNGVGKTHLAAAIIHHTWDTWHGALVLVPQLLDLIRQSFNKDNGVVPENLLDAYAQSPMLVLDDFGSERVTSWVQETLFKMILDRELAGENRLTIITSNLTLRELRDYYNTNEDPLAGNRIASRAAAMCDVVVLTGADRRLQR